MTRHLAATSHSRIIFRHRCCNSLIKFCGEQTTVRVSWQRAWSAGADSKEEDGVDYEGEYVGAQ